MLRDFQHLKNLINYTKFYHMIHHSIICSIHYTILYYTLGTQAQQEQGPGWWSQRPCSRRGCCLTFGLARDSCSKMRIQNYAEVGQLGRTKSLYLLVLRREYENLIPISNSPILPTKNNTNYASQLIAAGPCLCRLVACNVHFLSGAALVNNVRGQGLK